MLGEQLLAVVFVLLLLASAIWVFQRKRVWRWPAFGRAVSGPALTAVLERVPLTAQHSLHVVKVGDRMLLVATHPSGISLEPYESPFGRVLHSAFGGPGNPAE
jgi:flagellar biogenesis protein FliO